MKSGSLWTLCGLIASTIGCGGGTGTSSSEVTVTVDGMAAESTEQTSGVDAAGNSFVVIGGDAWSVEIRFPGSTTGDFSSTSSAGATVIYTDAAGNSYQASDVDPTSAYTITVTSYSTSTLEGTFMVTVVGPGGVTHTVAGSFKLAFTGIDTSDPYGGTYIGMFRAQGQVQTGTDPNTGDPIWGASQVASVRVTVELELLAAAAGTAAYTVVHANISDAAFGCNVGGCVPAMGSVASLPEEPGTASMDGHGFALLLPNGAMILTTNNAGSLYSSTDARSLGNTLGLAEPWLADDSTMDAYLLNKFGDYYTSLNPATRSMSWAMTRSAL